MNDDETHRSASVQPSAPASGPIDEGRRYWKAAIAHLAPEKREAAWEFYLDRLESSAAADTLGGVMLLLEAHLAFFDDLPARLGLAAQQIEAAFQPPDRICASPGPISPASASDRDPVPPPGGVKRSSPFIIGIAAVLGGIVGCAVVIVYGHFYPAPLSEHSPTVHDESLTGGQLVAIEPWNDLTTGRRRGCIVRFSRVANAERTPMGEAKIYLQSPVEEVRENIRALQQLAR